MGYEYLREQYPEIISKDQLYRICHISKRKARWLLENGIIPCEDSGKQTRRFHIRLEDVITFLERRDAGLLQAEIPVGIFSSGVHSSAQPRQTLDSGALCAFLLERWADALDMLTVQQAASLCGYGPAAINGWIGKGRMTALPCRGRNLIPKESLAERLASREVQLSSNRPEFYIELLKEFQAEGQNSGMEWGSMSL